MEKFVDWTSVDLFVVYFIINLLFSLKPLISEGHQDMPPQNIPLCHTDYFKLKIFEIQPLQARKQKRKRRRVEGREGRRERRGRERGRGREKKERMGERKKETL